MLPVAPLPRTLEVRKAAVRECTVAGSVDLAALTRLRAVLLPPMLPVTVRIDCRRDEQGRYLVHVAVSGTVRMMCQRCLQAVDIGVESEQSLAVVVDDERARQLPTTLEPLLLSDDDCDLWSLVEEEVLLALPSVPRHPEGVCAEPGGAMVASETEVTPTRGDNPFSILAGINPATDASQE